MITAVLGVLLLWAVASTGAAALFSAARALMKRATPAPVYGPSDYEWLDDAPCDCWSQSQVDAEFAAITETLR